MAFKVLAVDSWDVTPCGLMGGNQHFEGISYFHLQTVIPGWANRNARRILEHRILKDGRITAVPCEVAPWSITLKQNRHCMYVNRMLKGVFGTEGERGECRKLHNEELPDLCSSPIIILATKSRTVIEVGGISRNGNVCETEGLKM